MSADKQVSLRYQVLATGEIQSLKAISAVTTAEITEISRIENI